MAKRGVRMTTDVYPGEQTTTAAELVRAALAGDSDAWEGLFHRYDASLHRVARSFRLDKAAADDAVQTTWLRLVEHLDTLREPERIGAWLVTTLRRHIISTLRGRGREPCLVAVDDTDLIAPDRSPEELVTARDTDTQTRAALCRLPTRSRRLLTLLMESPAPSYGQVSAELSMPVGSIGPTRARSLSMLRRELETVGIGSDALSA
jgi:RNA polymerase sigma factor (sigma-70 family)